MIPRNNERPKTALEERLLKFAEEARAAAKIITPGREQQLLLRKADKAETLASAVHSLPDHRSRFRGRARAKNAPAGDGLRP